MTEQHIFSSPELPYLTLYHTFETNQCGTQLELGNCMGRKHLNRLGDQVQIVQVGFPSFGY